jgi:hypothetical protein
MNCVHYAPKSAHTWALTEARRVSKVWHNYHKYNALQHMPTSRLNKSSGKCSPGGSSPSTGVDGPIRTRGVPFKCHPLSPAKMALSEGQGDQLGQTHQLKVAIIRLSVSRWAGPDVPSDRQVKGTLKIIDFECKSNVGNPCNECSILKIANRFPRSKVK